MKFLFSIMHAIMSAAPERIARPRRPIRDTAPNRRGTAINAAEATEFRHKQKRIQQAIAIASQYGTPTKLIDCLGAIHLLHYRQPVLTTTLPPPVRHLRICDIVDDGGGNSDFKAHFRFKLCDMETLLHALDLPEPHADGFIRTPRNGYKYSNEEGVLQWLYYFARVGTLGKMASVFGGAATRSSEIVIDVTIRIHDRWRHRIVGGDLSQMDGLLKLHSDALLTKAGGAANLPWQAGVPVAFVDAKCLKICRRVPSA